MLSHCQKQVGHVFYLPWGGPLWGGGSSSISTIEDFRGGGSKGSKGSNAWLSRGTGRGEGGEA